MCSFSTAKNAIAQEVTSAESLASSAIFTRACSTTALVDMSGRWSLALGATCSGMGLGQGIHGV